MALRDAGLARPLHRRSRPHPARITEVTARRCLRDAAERQGAGRVTGDIAEAVAAARTAEAHLSQAAAALKRLSTVLESPLKTPSKGPDIIARNRREHRMGVLDKVASDPEPEAFIRARTDTLTFPRDRRRSRPRLAPGTAAQSQSSIRQCLHRNQPET